MHNVKQGLDHSIIFEKSEILHMHDDSLVIIVQVESYELWRVLIDNGKFSDLMYLSTL